MNCLREDFDEEDLQYLKKFVQKELIDQQKFTFPSQNQTNGLNMCQIVQMAFELKNIT